MGRADGAHDMPRRVCYFATWLTTDDGGQRYSRFNAGNVSIVRPYSEGEVVLWQGL